MTMRRVAFILLWVLVLTIPWQGVVTISGLGTITRFIGFAVIPIAGFGILVGKKIKEPPLFLILMGMFVIWSFITVFWSINQSATFGRFITNIQLLAMVWLLWELCDTQKDVLTIMQAYIFGAYVSITDMLITFLTSPAAGMRIAATGFDQNYIAITLALGIPIAWYLILKNQQGVFNFINLIYIPLSLFAVILTGSRGGMIVTMIALLIIPLTVFYLNKNVRYIVSIVVLLFIFFGTLYFQNIYKAVETNIERIMETPERLQGDNIAGRAVIWKAGLRVYKENPIIGVGAHGYRYAVQGSTIMHPSREDYFAEPIAPHNTYLSVLVDTGLIGFILFIMILLIAVMPVLYMNTFKRKVLIVLFMVLVIGLIPLNWETQKQTWFVLSLFMLHHPIIIRNMKFNIIYR